ncbi:hypothetical protein BJX99DRAFT_257936 [Aspergillus californicus]
MGAMVFNAFVNPIALSALQRKYYLVFVAVLLLFNVLIYLFYPETRQHSLEQVALIFDGDAAFQCKEAPLPDAAPCTKEEEPAVVEAEDVVRISMNEPGL